MKKSSLPIGLALTCVLFALNLHAATSNATNAPLHQWKPHKTGTRLSSPTPLQLQTHRGPASPRIIDSDTTEWSRQVVISNKVSGRVMVQTNSFTELGNGHNYLGNDGLWRRSRAQFVQQGNHFVAETGHHKVRLANNLNQPGAVDLITPSGVHLRSSPLAIGYYDPTTGQSVTLAVLQNCFGQQVSSNTVVFPDAFQEINCTVEFVDTPGGLHQNLIFNESPPGPASLGLTEAAHIQFITEFMPGTPTPIKKITRGIQPEQKNPHFPNRPLKPASPYRFEDETLVFGGEISFVTGKAFGMAGAQQRDATDVLKKFYSTSERSILIESASYKSLKPSFAKLPKSSVVKANLGTPVIVASVDDPKRLPARRTVNDEPRTLVAKFVRPENSVVLDYETLTGTSESAITFLGEKTYLISGPVHTPHLVIEGGSVIKFQGGTGAGITITADPIDCRTSQYLPAIFTAADDHTVGEVIDPNHFYDPSGYYADIALTCAGNNNDLHDLRFAYMNTAIAFLPGTQSHSPRHLQIRDGAYGIRVLGTSEWGSFASVNPDNVLFNRVSYCFAGNGYFLFARHLTVDGASTLASYSESDNGLWLMNCILANIGGDLVERYFDDNKYVGGEMIGYYNCNSWVDQPYFGDPQIFSESNPFETAGLGSHYLKADSVFRNAGDSAIYDLGAAFHSRSTQPPIVLQNFIVEGTIALLPQVPRYTDNSNPDLGAWYPAIDYLAIGVNVYSGSITLSGGAAVATMNGLDDYGGIQYGIRLNIGASLESRGLPLKPNRIFYAGAVQEQFDPFGRTVDAQGIGPARHFAIDDNGSDASFEFTEFLTLSRPHYHYFAQNKDVVKFQNCTFRRGYFADFQSWDGGTLALNNNLFEGVELNSFQVWEGAPARTTATFFNNTFERGKFLLVPAADDNTPANFTIKDNIFDGTTIVSESRLAHGYNCYNLTSGQRIGSAQTGDVVLNNSSLFASGPFGKYYQTDSALNNGSRTAAAAKFYHYTTQLDQTKKGNGQVGIGMHYLAASGGVPKDTDGDGIPDYVENKAGNGISDSAIETDWQNPMTVAGVSDIFHEVYDAVDLDGDGVPGSGERFFGTNPLLPDNPLAIPSLSIASPTGIISIPVNLGANLIDEAEGISLLSLDIGPGSFSHRMQPAAGADLITTSGTPSIPWNTSYHRNGPHAICLALSIGDSKPIVGPLRILNAHNKVLFPEPFDGFGDGLNILAIAGPNANYVIKLYDQNGSPITYNNNGTPQQMTLTGTSDAEGIINHDWDLTFPDGSIFTGEEVRGNFFVSAAADPADDGCPNYGPSAQPCNSKTWQREPYWTDGKFVVARTEECPLPAHDDRNLNAATAWVIDTIANDTLNNPYELAPVGYSQFVQAQSGTIWPNTADSVFRLVKNNRDVLLTAFWGASSRNFYWSGHASGWGIGYSKAKNYYANCQSVLLDYTRIDSREIRNKLDNHAARSFRHPYRMVFIDGCCGATGDLSTAFGIPNEQVDVEDYTRRKVPPRAFIGSTSYAGVGTIGSDYPARLDAYSRQVFFAHWMSGDIISECLRRSQQDFDGTDPLDRGENTGNGNTIRFALDKDYIIFGAQDLKRQ